MKLVYVLVLCLVFAVADAAPPEGGGMSIDTLTQELNLDDEQAVSFEQIMSGHRQQMQSLRELSRSERRSEMKRLRSETDEQLKGVLTDEQMQKFDELRQQMRKQHRGRGGKGPRSGDSG